MCVLSRKETIYTAKPTYLYARERVSFILQLPTAFNILEKSHTVVQLTIRDDHRFKSYFLLFFLSPCLPIYLSWDCDLLEVRIMGVI